MDPVVVAGVVGGAFALGGVVLGGAMNWAAGWDAERRAAAGRRDEAFGALVEVCTRLQSEAMSPETMSPEKREAGRERVRGLVSEVMLRTLRLSMVDDEAITDATGRVGDAIASLVRAYGEPGEVRAQRVEALSAALAEVRRARNAAAAPWWRRRRLRRAVSP
jgi:hypothetical protein